MVHALAGVILVVTFLGVLYLMRLNRQLHREIADRSATERELRRSQLVIAANNRQLEQLSLAAVTALSIRDEQIIGMTVSNAIVDYSDYERVIISLFTDESPYREIIGFAGIDEQTIDRLRTVELPKSWYDRVFRHGMAFGRLSYYIPHTMKQILNQEATVYGTSPIPDTPDGWHPEDNLFVRMNDDEGNFIGVISVDNAKSGRRPSDDTVRPLEIFSSMIAQIIVLKREHEKRMRLEEQLRHAQKMEAIGNLTGGIAHDFNNILGIIIGHAEIGMLNDTDIDTCHLHLREINDAAVRARDIIRQLLSFSRKSMPVARPTRIRPIISEALRFLRSTLPSAIEIRSVFKDNQATILADQTQLYQIVINLCTNSAQAMESGGTITVTIDQPEYDAAQTVEEQNHAPRSVRLIIEDTGSGIEEEILPHIFDPYFTTKEIGKGTGLGLAVVQGIVASHNGQLSVESTPDVGTRFTILFPALDEEPESPNDGPEPPAKHGSGTILFVDDEQKLTMLGKVILENHGYKVTTCSDPQQALQVFGKSPESFDLVITDFTMPGINGISLAREIWAIRPGLPILLCSGYTEQIDDKQAAALGFTAFLSKPITTGHLVYAVHAAFAVSGN